MIDIARFYWKLLLRRSPAMMALVVLMAVVAAGYALNLPNRYEATARLLVEDPQIPDELATSTVTTTAAEQASIIEQRLTSRTQLIEIAHEFDVFPEERAGMSPDGIARRMKEATTINVRARRNRATFIDVGFIVDDPETAADVVNEYVTRLLEDNIAMRTQRAGNTLEFFERQVEKLSAQLAEQSGRLSAFKAENSNTLPEALNFRLNRESALEERMLGLRREYNALQDQRERVVSVFEETGRLQRTAQNMTPEERQLRDLESELSSALAIYSETHPSVSVLRTRIEQLERVVAGQDSTESAGPSSSVFDVTLAEIDARGQSLQAQISDVSQELETLRAMIEKTPQTAIALEGLQRDYNNVQAQYNSAVERLSRARTGEQIELSAQGQRITVVENAIPPEFPSSPRRKLIVAAGGFAGVAAALGLFALLEIVNSSIRRPAELVARVGITPLAVIPYIPTRREQIVRRTLLITAPLVLFVVVPAMLFALHTYYMPLPEALEAVEVFIKGLLTS